MLAEGAVGSAARGQGHAYSTNAIMRIFLSYRRDDTSAEAFALYGLLETQPEVDVVYLDRVSIPLGQNWLTTIKTELARADILLVLIGPAWLTARGEDGQLRLEDPDDLVRLEILAAFKNGATVIPLLLDSTKMPAEADLPTQLRQLALLQGVTLPQITEKEVLRLMEQLASIPEKTPKLLGGFFGIEGHIASSRFIDVYVGVPDSSKKENDFVAVHVLRESGETEAAHWFEERCRLWKRVPHPNVVELHDRSDFRASSRVPFYAVPSHASEQTLENAIRKRGGFKKSHVTAILSTAADICSSAHQQDVLLQSIDPGHFWLDQNGELRYEGFDAAVSLNAHTNEDLERIRKFCDRPDRLAPEVESGLSSRTADVYALGMLLRAMESESGQPMNSLVGKDRRDLWAAMAFHCLWNDANGRFLTPNHFMHFLNEAASRSNFVPVTLAMAESDTLNSTRSVNGVRQKKYIGRSPVTNFEYEYFCIDTGYPIRAPDFNSRRITRRIQGPFCPVVNVNLNDAQRYCKWLSDQTGELWRLPKEEEWNLAAMGSDILLHEQAEYMAMANYGNRFGGPTVVGGFPETQSKIGCWDMLGNVWEWCADHPSNGSALRTIKGGAYSSDRSKLGIIGRSQVLRTCRASDIGFRVLREE